MASRFRVRHPTLWRTFSPLDLQAEFPDLDSEDSEGEETGKGITGTDIESQNQEAEAAADDSFLFRLNVGSIN